MNKLELPDCTHCGCMAENHIMPPENTGMTNKCSGCDSLKPCPGYQGKTQGEKCPDCDSESIVITMEFDSFQYGNNPGVVIASGLIPVYTCRNCNFQYTDYRAEDARMAAIEKHLLATGGRHGNAT